MIKCLRRKLALCKSNLLTNDEQQYSLYPKALAVEEGYPQKESKSLN